jgi:hopanoid biosynthesis associated protein HpnK
MTIPGRPTRRLIVNGDDFGMSVQVNAGIIHAHQYGILTNTSLMVTGQAWQEAVERAREAPTLSVGLHLTLMQGRSVLPPHLIPALTDFGGNFSDNPMLAGLRYFFSRQARIQLRAECRAQIERFLSTGLSLAQVDGHLNIHMHPTIVTVLIDLAKEYGIPAIRLTRENIAMSLSLDPRHAIRKRWESFIFTSLSRHAERKLRAAGIVFPDAVFGLHQSGEVNEDYVLQLLPKLSVGVTELYCHPAFLPCLEVQRWTPTYRRDDELAALTSQKVRSALVTQEITLTNYREVGALHGA